jgi:hypothetical protein
MAKRGELKPVDKDEERIRSNAKYYTVVGFKPGEGRKLYQTFDNLVWAKAYCKELLRNGSLRLRATMIYAVDEYDRNALVGTMNLDEVWKDVEVKRYA